MDDWQRVLWDKSVENQAIELNPDAALQAVIFGDGFVPVESEFWTRVSGVDYAAQAAEHLRTGERRVYYAIVPNWTAVSWFGYEAPHFAIVDVVDSLAKHPTKRYETRPLKNISELVIHHTVSPGDVKTTIIAQYHVFDRDWPGIGYHYVIDKNGRIELVNYHETVSYHAGGTNGRSLGIALKGDFSDYAPPRAQLDAASWLVKRLRGELAITQTLAHKETPSSSTECPGDTWAAWKTEILA